MFSPPCTPRYNGACEAGIGGLKARTHHLAARRGRPGRWTTEDVEAARRLADEVQYPRRLRGRTADGPQKRFLTPLIPPFILPLTVRFMGLYDPVDMHLTIGDSEVISGNVATVATVHAIAPTNGDVSRALFNRIGYKVAGRATMVDRLNLPGTHSAIGGAPWNGDYPAGHSEQNDIYTAMLADIHIRARAVQAGVPIREKTRSEYGYQVQPVSFGLPQGVVPRPFRFQSFGSY